MNLYQNDTTVLQHKLAYLPHREVHPIQTDEVFRIQRFPVLQNNICINGQLMILDLLEHLETIMGDRFELLQSNTDGIIVRIQNDEKSERMYYHICNEWCLRTRMTFAHDRMDWYSAKDVNNYIFAFTGENKVNKLFDILKKEFPEISLQDGKIVLQ